MSGSGHLLDARSRYSLCFSLWRRPPTGHATPCNNPAPVFLGGALCPKSDYSRKHALECMRLSADSMQLAGDIQNPALQSHFVRMAKVWSDRAVRGPNGDTRMESAYPIS